MVIRTNDCDAPSHRIRQSNDNGISEDERVGPCQSETIAPSHRRDSHTLSRHGTSVGNRNLRHEVVAHTRARAFDRTARQSAATEALTVGRSGVSDLCDSDGVRVVRRVHPEGQNSRSPCHIGSSRRCGGQSHPFVRYEHTCREKEQDGDIRDLISTSIALAHEHVVLHQRALQDIH